MWAQCNHKCLHNRVVGSVRARGAMMEAEVRNRFLKMIHMLLAFKMEERTMNQKVYTHLPELEKEKGRILILP